MWRLLTPELSEHDYQSMKTLLSLSLCEFRQLMEHIVRMLVDIMTVMVHLECITRHMEGTRRNKLNLSRQMILTWKRLVR